MLPISFVTSSVRVNVNAKAMGFVIDPVTIIDLSLSMSEDTLALGFA